MSLRFRRRFRDGSARPTALPPKGAPRSALLGPAAPTAPRRRGGAVLGLVLLAAAAGCASGPDGPVLGSGRVVRPHAAVEYDVLVGELAMREHRYSDARKAYLRAREKDPDAAFVERRLGVLSYQLEDLDSAVAHAERAVELDPDDEEGRLLLGRLHRIRRDPEAAEAALRGPDGELASYAAGLLLYQVYLDSGRNEDALATAEQLVALDPEDLRGTMAEATAHERMGRLDEAEAALRRALDRHPEREIIFGRLARLRRSAGDREGEVEVYRELLERYPNHYGTLVSLGEALIAENDVEGAIAAYRQIVEHYPDDLQSLRRCASLEYAAGRYEQASERLRGALRRHPERFELAYSLGTVRRGAGDEAGALAAFGRVPPSHPAYVEARLQVAGIFEDAGDEAAALAELERVRELRPSRSLDFHVASLRARTGDFEGGKALLESLLTGEDDDEVLYQLGVLHGMHQRVDEALEYMRRTLDENPENAHALNYIGYTWAERGENLDEAEAMIRRALEQRPNDGFITDSLGWVYYMRARPLLDAGERARGLEYLEKARDQLRLAAELTGGDPVVSEHLGDVHRLLDDKQRALEFYREAVELEYREEEQPDLLEKLERLQDELGRVR